MIRIQVAQADPYLLELVETLKNLPKGQTPITEQSLAIGASILQEEWWSYANGAAIPGTAKKLRFPTGRLAASIKRKRISRFAWMIYSDDPVMRFYDTDTGEKDYKLTHPYGRKSRVSKKGVPYLIVPFRHNVPGSAGLTIPKELYSKIRAELRKGTFLKSVINPLNKKIQPNYAGEPIVRQGYDWGSRIQGLSKSLRNYEGMVVMDTSTARKASSAYFTFRVISAKSPPGSWMNPERPSLTKFAVQNRIEDVKELIAEGVARDLGL